MTMEWNDDVQPDQPVEETQELRHAPAPAEAAPEAVEPEPVALEAELEPEAHRGSLLEKEISLPFGRKKQPKTAKHPKTPKEPKAAREPKAPKQPKAKRGKPAK